MPWSGGGKSHGLFTFIKSKGLEGERVEADGNAQVGRLEMQRAEGVTTTVWCSKGISTRVVLSQDMLHRS